MVDGAIGDEDCKKFGKAMFEAGFHYAKIRGTDK